MATIIEKLKNYTEVVEALEQAEVKLEIKKDELKTLRQEKIKLSVEKDTVIKEREKCIAELKEIITSFNSTIEKICTEKEKIIVKYELLKQEKKRINCSLGGMTKQNNKQGKIIEELEKKIDELNGRLVKSEKLRDPHAAENYINNFVKTRNQRKKVSNAKSE